MSSSNRSTTIEDGNGMADKDRDETERPIEMTTSQGDGMSRKVKESGEGEDIEPSHEELNNDRCCDARSFSVEVTLNLFKYDYFF